MKGDVPQVALRLLASLPSRIHLQPRPEVDKFGKRIRLKRKGNNQYTNRYQSTGTRKGKRKSGKKA